VAAWRLERLLERAAERLRGVAVDVASRLDDFDPAADLGEARLLLAQALREAERLGLRGVRGRVEEALRLVSLAERGGLDEEEGLLECVARALLLTRAALQEAREAGRREGGL
jgi:hypothetical protein